MTRRLAVCLVVALAFASLTGTAAQQDERVYVVGFVKSPGSYVLGPDMTVGDALDVAGGFAPGRIISGLEIIRMVDGEKQTTDVTINDPVQANDTVRVR